MQGARGRRACLGRAGVARRRHGRWGAGQHGRGGAGRWSAPARGSRRGERAWARGLGAGRAAWAPGLALGNALGALGTFSIRFDSFFFFPESTNEHRSL